jgi:hypothetical protein
MWPFGRKGVATRLADIEDRTEVELAVTVVSPNAIASPMSGVGAAFLSIEVLERLAENDFARRGAFRPRGPAYESLGEAVLGDVVVVRDAEGNELSLIARRVRFRFAGEMPDVKPLANVPEAIARSIRSTEDRGPLVYREVPIREGDRIRVQAFVEPALHAITLGYRSAPKLTFAICDDVAPVFVEVGGR